MIPSNYEGPRGGDYARYVEQLLRTSPLYLNALKTSVGSSRRDFTAADALRTPGSQPSSALERMREQALAAVAQAQKQARQAQQAPRKTGTASAASPGATRAAGSGAAANRKPRAPRQELEIERAAREAAQRLSAEQKAQAPAWWRITPGRIVFALILLGLSVAFPGMGAMLLMFAIIHVVRSAVKSLSAK